MPGPAGFGPAFLPGGQLGSSGPTASGFSSSQGTDGTGSFNEGDPAAFRPYGYQGTDGINDRANGSGPGRGNGSGLASTAFGLGSNTEGAQVDQQLSRQLGVLEGVVNRNGESGTVDAVSRSANTSSDRDAAQFERATRGQDLSARQQGAAKARLTLSRSLNRASAAGDTRRGFAAQSDAAAASGAGFADAFFSQRLAGETNITAVKAYEEANAAQRSADKKNGIISAIGSIAGAAIGAFFSSENLKHDHGRETMLLDRLKKVRVNRWQYKGDDKTHVGPFSEEFNREFGIDTDRPDMISVIDALGVTLGAVKELDEKVSAHGR